MERDTWQARASARASQKPRQSDQSSGESIAAFPAAARGVKNSSFGNNLLLDYYNHNFFLSK